MKLLAVCSNCLTFSRLFSLVSKQMNIIASSAQELSWSLHFLLAENRTLNGNYRKLQGIIPGTTTPRIQTSIDNLICRRVCVSRCHRCCTHIWGCTQPFRGHAASPHLPDVTRSHFQLCLGGPLRSSSCALDFDGCQACR